MSRKGFTAGVVNGAIHAPSVSPAAAASAEQIADAAIGAAQSVAVMSAAIGADALKI